MPNAPTITHGAWAYDDGYQITLNWTAGSDGGSPITGWQYSQQGGPYAPLSNVSEVDGAYSASFDSGIRICGRQESYTIEAINGQGTSAASNAYVIDLRLQLFVC